MRKPCCLNCAYFYAYSNECCRNYRSDEEVEIENPGSTKCEDWKYDEFTAFVSGYQDEEEVK